MAPSPKLRAKLTVNVCEGNPDSLYTFITLVQQNMPTPYQSFPSVGANREMVGKRQNPLRFS